MGIKSTVKFNSNLQKAEKNVPLLEDRLFYNNIFDPFAIGSLKKYRPNDLSALQREIYEKVGIHCKEATEGDYPWGTVIDQNGKPRVVCKCSKIECKYFNQCRPEIRELGINSIEDSFEQKRLKNNTSVTVNKKINCSFDEYRNYTEKEKMRVLLDYWEISNGPIAVLKFTENDEVYVFNEKGQNLINPFTTQPIIISNAEMYKFSYLVFDVIDPCTNKEELIHFVHSARYEECFAYAEELLYSYKLSKVEVVPDKEIQKRRLSSQEIKNKYGAIKDEKYCRHAGCYEFAVRDGYCSEHIRYQKAESK